MAGVFDQGRDLLLTSLFGRTTTPPATWHVALLTALPTVGMTGSSIPEPAGGYARAAVPNDAANWVLDTGLLSNLLVVEFPTPTADWGLINYYALTTAATGGTAVMWGELRMAITAVTGTPVRFDSRTLTISVSSQ